MGHGRDLIDSIVATTATSDCGSYVYFGDQAFSGTVAYSATFVVVYLVIVGWAGRKLDDKSVLIFRLWYRLAMVFMFASLFLQLCASFSLGCGTSTEVAYADMLIAVTMMGRMGAYCLIPIILDLTCVVSEQTGYMHRFKLETSPDRMNRSTNSAAARHWKTGFRIFTLILFALLIASISLSSISAKTATTNEFNPGTLELEATYDVLHLAAAGFACTIMILGHTKAASREDGPSRNLAFWVNTLTFFIVGFSLLKVINDFWRVPWEPFPSGSGVAATAFHLFLLTGAFVAVVKVHEALYPNDPRDMLDLRDKKA